MDSADDGSDQIEGSGDLANDVPERGMCIACRQSSLDDLPAFRRLGNERAARVAVRRRPFAVGQAYNEVHGSEAREVPKQESRLTVSGVLYLTALKTR